MTRFECLYLWARSDEKRRNALAAGHDKAFAFNEAAKLWNAWAAEVLAELAELKSRGESLLPFKSQGANTEEGWDGRLAQWKSSHSEAMRGWIDKATVDFSGHVFRRSERSSQFASEARGGSGSRAGAEIGHNDDHNATSFDKDEMAAFRFVKFIFPGPAQFGEVCFAGPVSFSLVTFKMPVSFNDATFEWVGSFGSTIFEDDFSCRTSQFNMGAFFRDAQFHKSAAFYGTIFNKEARFQDVHFDEGVSFVQADFNGFTDFSGAQFKKNNEFIAVTVKRAVDFSKTWFERVPDFSQAQFDSAPSLDSMTVDPAEGFWRSVFWQCDEGMAAHYRELKRLAIQAHNHDLESKFFRGEQRAYRSASCSPWPWKTGSSRWWLSVAYDALSNFGGSAIRPLLLWAISIPCFAVLYGSFSLESCAVPEKHWVSLFLSASNALPGASPNKTFDLTRIMSTCLNASNSNKLDISLGYIGMLQYVWSIALLFLFGLGLRNLFRIK